MFPESLVDASAMLVVHHWSLNKIYKNVFKLQFLKSIFPRFLEVMVVILC